MLLLIAVSHNLVYSQYQGSKWFFGNGSVLDFVTNPPGLSSVTFTNTNASASMSDAGGNLLFYTNGNTVFTKTHTNMANGTGLFGQGFGNSLIVPKPGNLNLFYVFTLKSTGSASSAQDGLYYSIVDMSLASGQGSVTVKNALVYLGSVATKLTGTRHCNGSDYWVVIQTCSGLNTLVWNGVYSHLAYAVTAAGLNTVASASTFTYNYPAEYSQACKGGQMKISPNGKKLASANYGFILPYNSNIGSFEIYDFDNSTGLTSNFVPLYTSPSPAPTFTGSPNASGIGVEFSSDGSKLYGSLGNNYYYPNGSILQWNLCAVSNSALAASQMSIAAPNYSPVNGFTGIQIAPNGKLYTGPYSSANVALSVINSPNLSGAAAGFSLASQAINSSIWWFATPNFIGSFFFMAGAVPPFSTTVVSSTLGCQVLQFQSPMAIGATYGNCPANTYTVQSLAWNFGDPASAANNTSTLSNPTHTFSSVGLYSVTLTLDFGCGGGSTMLKQTVYISSANIGNLSYSQNLLCNGVNSGTAAYTGTQTLNLNYFWTNGTTSYTSNTVSNLSAGNWSSAVINTLSGCQINTVFTIQQPPPLAVSLLSPTICQNYTQVINVSGGTGQYAYLWSSGAVTSTAVCINAGLNTATVSDANNCQAFVSFSVTHSPVLVTSNATLCAGQSATLQAGGASSYSWSGGAVVSPTATTTYTLKGEANGCISQKIVNVTVNALPNVNITTTSATLCSSTTVTLNAGGANTYTWQPMALNTTSLLISPLITTTYTLSGTDLNGCQNSQQLTINVVATPTLQTSAFHFICGSNATLNASGAENYTWMPGNYTTALVLVNPPTTSIYSLTGANGNCTANAVSTVSVGLVPQFNISLPVATLCAGHCFSFNGSAQFSQYVINWGDSTATIPGKMTHCYINSGNYNVSAMANYTNGCLASSTNTVNISVLPLPEASLLISGGTIQNVNTAVSFEFGSLDTCLYQLEFGDGSPLLSASSYTALTHTYSTTGNFCSKLISLNSKTGCSDSVKICLDVVCNSKFEAPNVFTPNGDGINERFLFNTTCIKYLECVIVDRWGGEVYKWSGTDGYWDGKTKQGRQGSDGVYFYALKYIDFAGNLVKKAGAVELIR